MSQKSINDLNLNSITISNSNDSKNPSYVPQENTLTTNNSGTLLMNGLPISVGITLTTYSLSDDTPLVPVDQYTPIFSTEIYPPPGTYIVSSTFQFNGYDANGDPVNIISALGELFYAHGSPTDTVIVTKTESNILIPSSTCTIQTCGIFTSDGLGELIVTGKVIELDTDGTQYNMSVANAPQIQLIKIV